MTDGKYDADVLKDTAIAVPAADRSGQPNFAVAETKDPDEIDLADTTSIRHGAQAVTGRYVWSASRMAMNGDALALYEHAKKAEDQRSEREMQELARLAEWNTQMTMVGGVSMTNGEAQDARQHVIDNDDAYAQRAIERGDIGEGDREAFKQGIRRKKELEDKRGRGTMTDAEAAEAQQLEASRVGRAIDRATADNHVALGWSKDSRVTRADANVDLRSASTAPPVSESVFQDYAASQRKPDAMPAESNVAARVKAIGLDL